MDTNLIKAHINLFAVLQNLEDLVKLDDQSAQMARTWDLSIQFSVMGGPSAHVIFKDGACTHGIGKYAAASIKLLFTSPAHLNAMFDGKGTPIPLKGFSKLGFLSRDFAKLTGRLSYFLRPEEAKNPSDDYSRISTVLLFHTAFFAVGELVQLDTVSRKVVACIPDGTLQVEILPDGPAVFLDFHDGKARVAKGYTDKPIAVMSFRDFGVANVLLTGQLDGFLGLAEGKVMIRGLIPFISNVNLILDRVKAFLS
ncbi:MAG: hypothetical protein GWP08_08455 [Nitrospiraceae bacterium]|nr:hypothetical protein [Nitrospiraceae bacterium]